MPGAHCKGIGTWNTSMGHFWNIGTGTVHSAAQMLTLPGVNCKETDTTGKSWLLPGPHGLQCLSTWCLSFADCAHPSGSLRCHSASLCCPAPLPPPDFQPFGDSEAVATWHQNNPSASKNNKPNNYKQSSCLNQLCVFYPSTGVSSTDNSRKSLRVWVK